MPEILKSVPNLVWVLIGDGPKKKSVMEMIQKNNLQNVVRFLGEVPHNELKKFYHLAESFVLLTHPDEGKEEGVGMVFLEAAACGVPCVAGKSGGVPEAVRDGETGVLVDIYRGDELLIKQIVDLLGDRERLQRLGNNAKLRVQYDFRWDSQLAKIKQWL
jgi:phosphatidylinositol alpha-1,6-mannosyltransferase